MTGRRVALRLAARSMRRDRRRTLIVVAALALPLAVAIALSTLHATSVRSDESLVAARIGQSQTVASNFKLVTEDGVEAALKSGPGALAAAAGRPIAAFPEVNAQLPSSAGDKQVDSYGYGLDLTAPIHRGRFEVIDGRPARTDTEVALSAPVAERLRVRVGEVVGVGPDKTPLTVTGVLAIVTDTQRKFVVTTALTAARNAQSDSTPTPGAAIVGQETASLVWHTPEALHSEGPIKAAGWSINERAEAFHENRTESGSVVPIDDTTTLILSLALLILIELGLVFGAIYAIVVRSSRRELGLLAAAGAGPKVRRAVITYQGVLAGLAATLLAGGVGTAVAWIAAPYAAERSFEIWGPLHPDPFASAVLVLFGFATPAIAARFAGRGVRFNVVAALRDQADPGLQNKNRVSAVIVGVLTMGVLCVIGGAVVRSALPVALGALALVVGLGVLTGQLLPMLGQRGDKLRLLHRVALRLTSRSAARAATLATVVASITLLAGLVLAGMGGLTERTRANYLPSSPDGSALIYATRLPKAATIPALTEAFGGAPIATLGVASPPHPDQQTGAEPNLTYWGAFEAVNPVSDCVARRELKRSGTLTLPEQCVQATGFPAPQTPVMVVSEADAETVLGRRLSTEERQGLDDGKALVLDHRLAPQGTVSIQAPDPAKNEAINGDPTALIAKTLPAIVAQRTSPYRALPMVYVTAAGLTKLGGVTQPNEAYFYVPATAGKVSPAEEDLARAALAADIQSGYFVLDVERGPDAVKILQATTVAAIMLLVFLAVALAFITVALSTQEMGPDLSALAAAGATQRFRSLLSGSHAGQVTLLGIGIGLAVTLAATPALLLAMDVGWSYWPWLGLATASASAVGASVLAGWISGSRVTTILKRTP